MTRALKAYRFKPNTQGPILWLVSFLQSSTVIVKAMLKLMKRTCRSLPKLKMIDWTQIIFLLL